MTTRKKKARKAPKRKASASVGTAKKRTGKKTTRRKNVSRKKAAAAKPAPPPKKTVRRKASSKKKITKKKAAKTPSQRGRSSRQTGHSWERKVVNLWKERFADREWADSVRRTDQGHKAHLGDIHGVPRLWQEAGINSAANPKKKLAQAIRDSTEAGFETCVPIAVLRPKQGRYDVHLRLSDLAFMLGKMKEAGFNPELNCTDITVQLGLASFMELYDMSELELGAEPVL